MPIYPQPFREQLVVVAHRDTYATSAAAGAAGTCEVTFDVPSDETWLVDRVTVTNTSTTITQANVYVGDVNARNRRAGTETGNADSAEGTEMRVEPGRTLRIVWTAASPGAVGTASIEYRVAHTRGQFG